MALSKTFRLCLGTTILAAAFSGGPPLAAQIISTPEPIVPADYRIRVGDVVEVWVYQHPELSRRFLVRGDGNHTLTVTGSKVSHPSRIDVILRDLKVVDLSMLDAGRAVRAKLESTIPNPDVKVFLIEFVVQPLPPSTRPSPQLQDRPPQDCCIS